jgi:hypothetical protein
MKKPLAVGDRVRVYGREWDWHSKAPHFDGEVLEIADDGVCVKRSENTKIWCHPKQVRRLVKKERRRVWLWKGASWNDGTITTEPPVKTPSDWVAFVEVKVRP